MNAREQTVAMLQAGKTPGQIARDRGVTLATVLGYLDAMIGRGAIRRSDVLFSIPTERRTPILLALQDGHSTSKQAILGRLNRKGFSIPEEDVDVVLRYGDGSHALGDMYDDVRTIETGLHLLIRRSLEVAYGAGDSGWWRQGVPKDTRVKCAERREDDDGNPASHSYCYTDLLDLKDILHKQWDVISGHLPKLATKDKKALLMDLVRLNEIRRMVMHPVRGVPSEDDFEFVRDLKARLGHTAKLSSNG